MLKVQYKGWKFKYSLHNEDDEFNGILIATRLQDDLETTTVVKNMGINRVFQLIESFHKLI